MALNTELIQQSDSSVDSHLPLSEIDVSVCVYVCGCGWVYILNVTFPHHHKSMIYKESNSHQKGEEGAIKLAKAELPLSSHHFHYVGWHFWSQVCILIEPPKRQFSAR